ncbi:MAG: hypothetical protein QXX56_05440 [Candidatus Bathyarchaeia archaeon]
MAIGLVVLLLSVKLVLRRLSVSADAWRSLEGSLVERESRVALVLLLSPGD